MGWVPDNTSCLPKHSTGPLKGHYTLQISQEDGSKTMIVADLFWVKTHYKKEVLKILQDKAYQKMEIVDVTNKL
jgi:hypothetical protein